jgi:hypothetical protein
MKGGMSRSITSRNQWLIDLGAEIADRHRNVRNAIRTNTLGVRNRSNRFVRIDAHNSSAVS